VWERFGHNFLLFQDVGGGWDVAYHWGVFSFNQVDFVPRLIKGTMLYGMGRTDLENLLAEYQVVDRPVWSQELALTPSQRWELLNLVEENFLPENRDYRYDYYRDNCSTRVRDMLNRVLDGALEDQFSADTTDYSFRWHTRRVLQEMPGYYLGIQFVLGPSADRPITVWDEMFLPVTLMDRIGELQVPDNEGGTRSLIRSDGALLGSSRAEEPSGPPMALPIFLAGGLLLGGAMILLTGSGAMHKNLGRRAGVSILAGGWSLVAGVGGSILLGAWLFTDHFFWYRNFNLFQVNPLSFLLLIAVVVFFFSGRLPGWGRKVAAALAILTIVGLLLELLPGIGQKNAEILALTVPVNLALWFSFRRIDTPREP
jgi:hypothetical protein